MLLLLAILAASHLHVYPQSTEGSMAIVHHYTAADRMPGIIRDLVFDRNGLMWIVPESDNIRLFDGVNLRVLESPAVKGIPQFDFSHVMKDSNGNPCFVNLSYDALFRLNKDGGLSYDSLIAGGKAELYNKGDHFFDWDRFISGANIPSERQRRSDMKIKTGDKRSFTSFDDSTFAWQEEDSMFLYRNRRLTLTKQAGIKATGLFMLQGRIFLLGPAGFQRYEDSTGTFTTVTIAGDLLTDTLFRQGLAGSSLRLYRSEWSHVMCGSRLYRIQYTDGRTLSTSLAGDIGFIHSSIKKVVYQPRDQVTAIATGGEGLYILKPNSFYSTAFKQQFLILKRKNIFYPVTMAAQDTFMTPWCKFSGNGNYRLLDTAHEGPLCFFADWAGHIWEGVKNKIVRYDQNMVRQGEQVLPAPSTLAVDFCEAIPGQLLCLTNRSILKYEDGAFTDLHPAGDKPPEGVNYLQIRYIGEGVYWLGSRKGVYRYDRAANTLKRIESIPEAYTDNITRLSGGSTLLMCYLEGFYYLYYKEKFFRIPIESDHPLKETVSVIEDRKGRIWFGTGSGFFVTTEKEIESWCDGKTPGIYYYSYSRDDGLQDLELNGGLNESAAKSADGYLVFNSMGGVIVFHQDSIREIFPTNGIQLAQRSSTGEEYRAGDSIRLQHDNNGVVIQVRVPYFGNRDNLRIEYSLTPEIQQWKEVDAKGRIDLGHLTAGTYTLAVRVRTGLLPGDYRVRKVAIVVPYLFYETLTFRILAAVLLLLVCIVVTVAIIRLRREVRLKNLRLNDQNHELQSALGELRDNIDLKEKLISLVLHDLKTPLYFQSLLFNQLVQEDYFKDKEGLRLFQDLKTSSSAILQFAKEFLTWYSSQREGFQVRNTVFPHQLLVDDLFSVYQDIALRKNLQLNYESRGLHTLFSDRKILEIIIRNLLDNAIKYTEKGAVCLIFERKEDVDSITVSDTGSGMSAAKINQLQQFASKRGEASSPTFGYRFIYTMAEKIGASIRINSTPGKGTSITIILAHAVEEPDITA